MLGFDNTATQKYLSVYGISGPAKADPKFVEPHRGKCIVYVCGRMNARIR